jgi:uncharacterized protein
MNKQLCLTILIVLSAVAVVWAIVEQQPVGRDMEGDAADRAGLVERIRECEKQIAEQRQIIRKHTLDSTSRSVDELFALFPAKYPQGNWKPADVTFEDCWFWSSDGLRLHGWYYRHPRPRAVLLFIHRNAGNLSYRAPVVKLLHDRFALSVLIFDYRGYGRSEGIPTLDGILRDARAARHKLAERERIADKDVVLLGESLGGAVAVDLASEDGARALILESTFSSLSDAAAAHYSEALANVLTADKLDSASKIKNYMGPLLQCHGDRDRTIPYDLGRKLFAAANEPKTFVTLPGKDHNDAKTEGYYKTLEAFLSKLDEK